MEEPKVHTDVFLKVLTWITVSAILVLVGLVSFWSFYPYQPTQTWPMVYSIVYPTDKVVKQGGVIVYEFHYNKTSSIQPTIQRQFIDGLIFNVAGNSDPTVMTVGSGIARVEVHVPETLPVGKYQLKIMATYAVNPIRNFHNDTITEEFEVVSGPHTDAEQDSIDENKATQSK